MLAMGDLGNTKPEQPTLPPVPNIAFNADTTLNEARDICFGVSRSRGWWSDEELADMSPARIQTALILVITEIAEAVEELRKGAVQAVYVNEGSSKPEGYEVEIADAVIRLFDLSGGHGADVAEDHPRRRSPPQRGVARQPAGRSGSCADRASYPSHRGDRYAGAERADRAARKLESQLLC